MKKDGIQTRNRKMSTKSKKSRKNQEFNSAMELLKPLDKPFNTFSPPGFNHAMHTPMPTYMSGHAGSLGSSWVTPSAPSHQSHQHIGGPGFHGLGSASPSTMSSLSMSSSFGGIPTSGLNLTTNTGMMGSSLSHSGGLGASLSHSGGLGGSYGSIPSGLNLSTNSSMVGAMA